MTDTDRATIDAIHAQRMVSEQLDALDDQGLLAVVTAQFGKRQKPLTSEETAGLQAATDAAEADREYGQFYPEGRR